MVRNTLITKVIAILLAVTFLGGCTYQSGPTTLTENSSDNYPINPRAKAILEKAINTTETEGEKFWFTGWIVTKVQKRRTNIMYDGTYVRDKGYIVNARVLGQPFRYYRSGNEFYMSEGDNWVEAPSSELPLEPFAGFEKILPFAGQARQLPDEVVLGRDCYVFEMNLSSANAAEVLPGIAAAANNNPANILLEQLEMKYRIWVGINDNFIYQLKTETWMPVPQAGSMHQEVYFRFWEYNSDSVTLTEPANIKKYLK